MITEANEKPEELPLTDGEVSNWWASRWFLFNGLLLLIGIVSVSSMIFLMGTVLPEGEDAIEPFALLFGIIVFVICANSVYLSSSRKEMKARKIDPVLARQNAVQSYGNIMRVGAFLTSVPLWYGILFWLGHLGQRR
jgi:hypothetical protein